MVVKLSGEALSGAAGTGVDPASLARVADEVLSVHNLGVQVAVVVGGGNYFRGRMAEGWGISRAEADNIGMLGTVMNALMLRGALTARTEADIRVMTAVPIHSVAEPFIRLKAMHHLERGFIVVLAGGIGQPYVTTDYPAVQRALELEADALLVAKHGVDGVYDSDPKHNPDAVRFTNLTYEEALAADIRIMDTSAFVLANEQSLTMHVFDVAAVGVMKSDLRGRRARHPDHREVAGRASSPACARPGAGPASSPPPARPAGRAPTPRTCRAPAQRARDRRADLLRGRRQRGGLHPRGHPAGHEPGRTSSTRTPVPCSESA